LNAQTVAAVFGGLLVLVVLQDAFEVLVLPQTVNRRLRPARVFYRTTWGLWTRAAHVWPAGKRRQGTLGIYGPLSLLLLFGFWAACLILGFALLQWGFGSHLDLVRGVAGFGTDLYMSGTTFFTLGLGDVTPNSTSSRILTVIEAGTGFGFLALVIGYLPVLYQAFARREINISLLDARAGSPPTAEELLGRHTDLHTLERLLLEWERWAAVLMESHLSHPTLAYYRSQHQNQSWLAALTTILDASAFGIASFEGAAAVQARLTFAMARHAVVDLAQVFRTRPRVQECDRLSPEALGRMRDHLTRSGIPFRADAAADEKLAELRKLYEPYVDALAAYFRFDIPAWSAKTPRADNWRTSAWEKPVAGVAPWAASDAHADQLD